MMVSYSIGVNRDKPQLTGLELCRAISVDPDLHDTPVVILSGRLLPGTPDVTQIRPSAMLTKPFTNHDLITAVKDILEPRNRETTSAQVIP
ncbi:hypothetical protein [Actinoplanes derwentensis]|uniref:hypothetical protein n=1 Tax=Actinoplanes derwentensis TaxID=113562 RepID=UPI000B815AB0|nr:hypothetical protein [Actinoplanes derwentensis]GID87003.1 hypothetical protein Ade03nite_59270 [Actinoplanes derwentensis]